VRDLFDASDPILKPSELVRTFTKQSASDLRLPARAIVTFHAGDEKALLKDRQNSPVEAWRPFRTIHQFDGSETVVTRCYFGGPNIAALIEELSAFGVREFCMFGYAGGIMPGLAVGDVIVATGACREDGVSGHYLPGDENIVRSAWADGWAAESGAVFRVGPVWSTDAIYRETVDKVVRFRQAGFLGVEMEVASLYAVCQARGLRGVAFLVVSDLLSDEGWKPGFHSPAFKTGVKRLMRFFQERVIV
jgi:uridine phosphorylase